MRNACSRSAFFFDLPPSAFIELTRADASHTLHIMSKEQGAHFVQRWIATSLLAGMLALPGPCVFHQLHLLPTERPEHLTTIVSSHPKLRRTDPIRASLVAPCPEHHEHRLTAQPQTTLLAKSQLAALPAQLSLGHASSAAEAALRGLTVAGPAPPLLVSPAPRAPPFAFPRV